MQGSYLSQVRQLRKVANSVMKRYAIEVIQLKFICHFENTTYKVVSKKGSFLFRIHRKDYHSKDAILEELAWLMQLSENNNLIQRPMHSINGLLVEEIPIGDGSDTRYCSVLSWVEGKMRGESLTQKSMFNLGQRVGNFHKNALKLKVKHRIYWDSEGLLGANATWGNILDLKSELKPAQFEVLKKVRLLIRRKVENYNGKNPHKSSMIHADLHLGNVIWHKNDPIPIDFDDCGFGFQMYDLAIVLGAPEYVSNKSPKKDKQTLIETLFEGYTSRYELSKEDMEILPYFILTRTLLQLTWGYNRRDNLSIYTYFKGKLDNRIKNFKKVLEEGPNSLY